MYLRKKASHSPLLTYKQSVFNPSKKKIEPTPPVFIPTTSVNRSKTHAKFQRNSQRNKEDPKEDTSHKEEGTWKEFFTPPEINPEEQILQGNILPPSFDALFSQVSTQKTLGKRSTRSDLPIIPTIMNGINLSISTYNSIVSSGTAFPTALLPLAPSHAPSVQWFHHNEVTNDWLCCHPKT